jgi:hypothetical protein
MITLGVIVLLGAGLHLVGLGDEFNSALLITLLWKFDFLAGVM